MVAQSTFFDGKEAWGKPVRVELRGGFLEVYDEASGVLEAKWLAQKLSRLKGSESVGEFCLTMGGAARLVLRNEGVQQAFLNASEPSAGAWWRGGDAKIAGWTALVVLLVGVFYSFGSAWVGRTAVALIPESVDRKIGAQAFQEITKGKKICKSTAGAAALAKLKRVALGKDFDSVRVVVLKSKTQNAIALLGGYVIIFNGLLDDVHSPDVLGGILTHEAGHIQRRHGMQGLVSVAALALTSAVLIGDISLLTALAVEAGTNRNTQRMEREADKFAAKLMAERNINRAPLGAWFDKLAKKEGEESVLNYFLTHPHSGERAALFKSSHSAGKQTLLTPEEWVALKNICS